jgi:hypothetical protein
MDSIREYETYALDLTNERFDVPGEAGIPFDSIAPGSGPSVSPG